LHEVAARASEQHHVRTLVINWWSLASEETFAVFGENGGHAGNNETAYVQAIVPEHIHPERYDETMATPYPAGTASPTRSRPPSASMKPARAIPRSTPPRPGPTSTASTTASAPSSKR
jgi:creatinine amidohydrolase